jgi:2-polyprenyl-3-methyl-5-hydroxy-6-metoxy-1,4-benzoquinol methylase
LRLKNLVKLWPRFILRIICIAKQDMYTIASPQTSPNAPGSPGALERLRMRFELRQAEAKVAGKTLLLPELTDPVAYIDSAVEEGQGGVDDLPYWTKLWPASLVMAGLAAGLKAPPGADPDEPILELGAGMGLPGLAAAANGRRVVLTDLHPDALEFARAAVEINQLEDKAEVIALDWTAPPADLGRFHTILGAEILYHTSMYPHLKKLIYDLLTPGGIAFIGHEERPFKISFFALLNGEFEMRCTQRKVKEADGETKVLLHALKRIA